VGRAPNPPRTLFDGKRDHAMRTPTRTRSVPDADPDARPRCSDHVSVAGMAALAHGIARDASMCSTHARSRARARDVRGCAPTRMEVRARRASGARRKVGTRARARVRARVAFTISAQRLSDDLACEAAARDVDGLRAAESLCKGGAQMRLSIK
jgi:hypothetical protein